MNNKGAGMNQYQPILQETEEGRAKLTKLIMRLFDKWELTTREQLLLLGLNESSRYMLSRYKKQDSIIPCESDKLNRVGLLLAVHKNLHALFPENESLRFSWIKRKNKMLDDRRPIDIMLEQGLFGIAKTMRFLDLQMVH